MTDIKDLTNEEALGIYSAAYKAAIGSRLDDKPYQDYINAKSEILRRMNDGWVSVEERLPDEGRYLVSGRGLTGVHILEYSDAEGVLDRPRWHFDDDYDVITAIDYWRELPTPPKEDKQ